MWEDKETTAPIPSVAPDGEQPSALARTDSITAFEEPHKRFGKIQAMTMPELMETRFRVRPAVIDGLLPVGTYLLAGAPKIGKSFLVLQMAYQVSMGEPFLGFSSRQGTVLYLALEDTYERLQKRLAQMTEQDSERLILSVFSETLDEGLTERLSDFWSEHADTVLIVIDTLQRVRSRTPDGGSYAADYDTLARLKEFSDTFGVTVLDHVDFSVGRGEVHALLGENGAGKSTLMNILAGVLPRDGGTVVFDGQTLEHITVQSTEHMGIAFVHQELNLFNDLKVYENIFLRKELLTPLGTLDKRRMIAQTQELMNRLGVDIDPTATVSDLETSKKQLLEIAKALHADAKLFILDEPTTALNNSEIDHLFKIVRSLKAEGKSFIFISHKMTEIFTIADRYTVLRNGRMIASGNIADTTPTEVTLMMVGSSYSDTDFYEPRQLGEPILELEHYSGEGFDDITGALLQRACH